MKIGIVTTTIRDGRNSINVANWVLEEAKKLNNGINYELVDLKDYDLPIFATGMNDDVNKWKEKMNELDGYIFVVAEYNHSPSGVFKNALDYLKPELKDKVASFVGYGGVGGARSIEQLKSILSQYQVANTQRPVNLMLMIDFVNMSEFKPKEYQLPALLELFEQNANWAKALKTLR